MVPERALSILAVRRIHRIRGRGAGLVRLDEGRQDLPVGCMVVVCGVGADVSSVDGLRPAVAHVVALARIVPCLQLDEVRL